MSLFSGNFKEEVDERLKFLFFLRNFKKKNKDWFDRIKKLPLKSRVGRNAIAINKRESQNGTVAFLKTSQKFEFYWVGGDHQPKEITAIAAFKIFEAEQSEKAVDLIAEHHDHVNLAIADFEGLEQELVQSQIDPEALGSVAMRSKNWLSEVVIKCPQVTDQQKENIKKMLNLINIGKYANLATEVDKLRKKNLKPDSAILFEIDKICDRYSINLSDVEKGKTRKAEKPMLILSESFN